MLLTGEVKDKDYQEPLRQQEAVYAKSSDQYLKADAETGKHYYDLNAASKSYAGPWLFGKEDISVLVGKLKANWKQWCPVPADVRDGVFMRGNVVYENSNGSYRMSGDLFEGEIRTEGGRRFFVGRTQHTFYGRDLPDGQLKVIANLNIDLSQRLSHNPMMVSPQQQSEMANYNQPPDYSRPNYAQSNYRAPQRYQQPQQPVYSHEPGYNQQQGQPSGYPQPEYNQQQPYQQQPYQQQQYQQPNYRPPNYPQQQPNYSQQPQQSGYPQPNYQQQPNYSQPAAPQQYNSQPEIRF